MNARVESGAVATGPSPRAGGEDAGPRPAVIARHQGGDPFDFDALRERALERAQAASGERWSDFNHHDPGVTLIDALCFVLTEDVFRARLPLTDLLTSPDGILHYRRHGLHAAERILPCRPCTVSDYARWLLDRVPGVAQVQAQMPPQEGLWRFTLQPGAVPAAQAEAAAARAITSATRAYWLKRNLGEDMDGLPVALRPRWCTLEVTLGIEGDRAPEEILAELVLRCAERIEAVPRWQSVLERLADAGGGPSLADVFDGPPLRNGWIDAASLDQERNSRVYFGDLERLARTIEGVAEVGRIAIVAHGLDGSSGTLPRQGEGWALRLHWPNDATALRRWHISRRGARVDIPIQPLLHRLEELRRHRADHSSRDRPPADGSSPLARPAGTGAPPGEYASLYRLLPRIYRNRIEAPSPEQSAESGPFKAYLGLLEQWLAHGVAQTRHLRELYGVGAHVESSYGWQMLGDEHIAGLEALYTADRDAVYRSVFAPADELLERRDRVLDHLLALHGEGLEQAAIRPYGWYFEPEAWSWHLFEQKRRMLLRIVELTRERYGALDYSRRSLGRRGNTAALQRRVSLSLAFKHHHSRLLMAPLDRAEVRLASESATPAAPGAAPRESRPLALWRGAARRNVVDRLGADLRGAARIVADIFAGLDLRALPPALLRCAVHTDRYHREGSGARRALWLGPDEKGRWWPLRLRSPGTSLPAAAVSLHEFACRLQLECEGLHLLEHILLRPGQGEDRQVPAGFYAHRLSVVLPGWTARGRNRRFRRLAGQVLAEHAPAHLRVHLVWLGARAMQRFERDFAAWLDAKREYCGALLESGAAQAGDPARRLERHARPLRRLLARRLRAMGVLGKEGQP